jgi:hypothetical protein
MQRHGVVNLLTLLSLDDDRLAAMGLHDDEERRLLFQGEGRSRHRDQAVGMYAHRGYHPSSCRL